MGTLKRKVRAIRENLLKARKVRKLQENSGFKHDPTTEEAPKPPQRTIISAGMKALTRFRAAFGDVTRPAVWPPTQTQVDGAAAATEASRAATRVTRSMACALGGSPGGENEGEEDGEAAPAHGDAKRALDDLTFLLKPRNTNGRRIPFEGDDYLRSRLELDCGIEPCS